jgi:hypothetical protein
MAKSEYKSNNRVNQIFDDLENYLDFCKTFGYRYDEADLYNNRSYVYRQFGKFLSGKPVKDQWEIDAKSA